MSSTDLSPGSHTLDRIESLEGEQEQNQQVDDGVDLSHLTSAEMKEDILAMAGVEPLSGLERREYSYARKFYKAEKVGILMFLLEQEGVGNNPIGDFCEDALQWQLEHINGAKRNALLGKLIGCEIDENTGTGNNASRLNRDQLKQLYRFLEEMN